MGTNFNILNEESYGLIKEDYGGEDFSFNLRSKGDTIKKVKITFEQSSFTSCYCDILSDILNDRLKKLRF